VVKVVRLIGSIVCGRQRLVAAIDGRIADFFITMHENSRSSPPPPASGFRGLPLIAVAGVLAVLTANVWVWAQFRQQQGTSAKEHDFWVLCQPGATLREREATFRRLVAAENRQWRAADLRELNLAGLSVPGAFLEFASFVRTNLAGANLAGARLGGSTLELADLSGANLSGANLTEARFKHGILNGASFHGAILCASSLERAVAKSADFSAADLSDVNCQMANLTGAKLNGANLEGAKLEAATLKGATLTEARLGGADLTDTDFTNANWWCARGLSMQQLATLKRKFSPTADADAALQADYARWAEVAGVR
jgi:uncharacterized protein YjbI with pentapeptide repeats